MARSKALELEKDAVIVNSKMEGQRARLGLVAGIESIVSESGLADLGT